MNHEVLAVLDSYGQSRDGGALTRSDGPVVEFLSGFIGDKRDFSVTLLFMGGMPGAWLRDMSDGGDVAALDRARRAFHDKAQADLDEIATYLVRGGFGPGRVKMRLRLRDFGAVHEVLAEVAGGLFDAVLLGPGGVQRLWDMLDDPSNVPMLRSTVEFPLWLCHAVAPEKRGVLVCADGSEASERAADHVGFMLQVAPDHAATVCSVAPVGREAEAEEYMARAMKQLAENGVDGGRVSTRVLIGTDPAEAIGRECERGGYAAVCLGRTGASTRRGAHVFMGSTALKVARSAAGVAVWAVR